MVADDQVQMAAVDAAQAVERVFDGAAVGEVAENPELVVAPDELVDVADDGVPMACDVADCFERRLIVAYVLFDSRVSGGASLRLPDITVFGAEPAIVQESAQCGDQRVAEMRVRSEIAHVVPYGMRLLDAFINDRAQHHANGPPQKRLLACLWHCLAIMASMSVGIPTLILRVWAFGCHIANSVNLEF